MAEMQTSRYSLFLNGSRMGIRYAKKIFFLVITLVVSSITTISNNTGGQQYCNYYSEVSSVSEGESLRVIWEYCISIISSVRENQDSYCRKRT